MEYQKGHIDRYTLFTIITKFLNGGLMNYFDQKKLLDVLVNTSIENWKASFNIMIHENMDLRLWQLVADIDPTFPVPNWGDYVPNYYEYMPTNETIILALDQAVAMYSSVLAMSN